MRIDYLTVGIVLVAWTVQTSAATLESHGGDAAGKSSFISGAIFDGNPPSPENDYVVVSSHTFRTPDFTASKPTNVVFAGRSLTLGKTNTGSNFALKTVYGTAANRAVVTIDDLRVYWGNINMASSPMGCLAGTCTIYGTSDRIRFQCSNDKNRNFEIACVMKGDTATSIQFENALEGSQFLMTGDMSEYLGSVHSICQGGRLVLACPYAASSTTIDSPATLTLGPRFSYVGTGTVTIPAGTRFMAACDAVAGTSEPIVLDAEHFTLPQNGTFELDLDTASFTNAFQYAGKSFPVVKIPQALRVVTADDFVEVTSGMATHYRNPSRSIIVTTDVDGMQTVAIVTRPFVLLSDDVESKNPNRSSGQWFVSDAAAWSDGTAPSPDKDYIAQKDAISTLRTGGGSGVPYVFPGHSLTVVKNLAHKNTELVVSNLVLWGGSLINAAGANYTPIWQKISGKLRLGNTTWDTPAQLAGSNVQYIDLESELSGDGTLMFCAYGTWTSTLCTTRAFIGGDNSAFTGAIRLYSWYYEKGMTNDGQTLEFTAPESLGGPLPKFDARALGIGKGCSLAPRTSVTLETANRGIWVDTFGRFIVTNGTFAIREPIRMSGSIRKDGGGVLALGGDFSFGSNGTEAPNGANNVLNMADGGLLPLTTNGCAKLSLAFGENARLIADVDAADADVRAFGLYNSYGAFSLPADGRLHVKILGAEEETRRFSVPVCTVTPEAAAMLKGAANQSLIAVDAIPKRSVRIWDEPVVVAGQEMVRFNAEIRLTGFTVIVR